MQAILQKLTVDFACGGNRTAAASVDASPLPWEEEIDQALRSLRYRWEAGQLGELPNALAICPWPTVHCSDDRDRCSVGRLTRLDQRRLRLPFIRLIIIVVMMACFALLFAKLVRQTEKANFRSLPDTSRCGEAVDCVPKLPPTKD